jgi:hypothetical protein
MRSSVYRATPSHQEPSLVRSTAWLTKRLSSFLPCSRCWH